jgi:integrase/recombinase XerD
MAAARRTAAQKRLDAVVEAWLRGHRSVNTRAAYRADVAHFRSWCDSRGLAFPSLTAGILGRYRRACEAEGASPASVARRLSAVGSFLEYAADADPGTRGEALQIARPTVAAQTTTALLTYANVAALLAASDEVSSKAALVIRLLLLDGLKVGEAVALDAAHVKGRPPRMTVEVTRDGEMRTLTLDPETAVAAHRYLAGRQRGPLLLSERPRGGGRLTRFGVDFVVKRVADAAQIEAKVSANTLRRHFVVAAHDRGVDLDEIRRNAGHADARTTRRYLPVDTRK